jgi:hypothetical protein
MPKYGRTKYVAAIYQDPRLIEEEEEEEELEEEDEDPDTDDEPSDEDPDGELEEDEDEDPDEAEEQDEDPDEADEDGDDEPARKPTRREARIRQLAKEKKEARAEAAAAKEQLRQIQQSQQQQNNQPRQPTAAEEAAYRASLSPEELIRYDVGKVLQTQRQQNELLQFNMQDMVDKQGYDAQASTNPVMKKYSVKVEERLKQLRMVGMNVPRLAILQNIIGERVLAAKGKKTVSRKKADENMRRNKTNAVSGRSNTTRESSRSGKNEREARYKRLENVTF